MKKKIAIIGGGNMGGAIASSIPLEQYDVVCTVKSEESVKRLHAAIPDITVTTDNPSAVEGAEIIILAVKPYLVDEVLAEIAPSISENTILASVVAALPIAELDKKIANLTSSNVDVFRVIPNTAIRNRKSVTFIAASPTSSQEKIAEVREIFDFSGKTFLIAEKDMAACTALASCGIAYFLRFIRALAEGSVQLGLRPGFATEVAALTAAGAASLLEDGSHPEVEIDKVTTPGGLTIRGLNAMEEAGFTKAVIAALKASV